MWDNWSFFHFHLLIVRFLAKQLRNSDLLPQCRFFDELPHWSSIGHDYHYSTSVRNSCALSLSLFCFLGKFVLLFFYWLKQGIFPLSTVGFYSSWIEWFVFYFSNGFLGRKPSFCSKYTDEISAQQNSSSWWPWFSSIPTFEQVQNVSFSFSRHACAVSIYRTTTKTSWTDFIM